MVVVMMGRLDAVADAQRRDERHEGEQWTAETGHVNRL
jgi:hypothetical protein